MFNLGEHTADNPDLFHEYYLNNTLKNRYMVFQTYINVLGNILTFNYIYITQIYILAMKF